MAAKNNSLPKWVVQLLAWGTGVGGLVADYGLEVFGKEHFQFVYYAMCIGIGFGIDPGFIVKILVDGYAAAARKPAGDSAEQGEEK